MGFSILYIVSFIILISVLFFFPQKKERANAVLWFIICLVFYECWVAFIAGVFSLIHLPVGLMSVSIANIAVAVIIQGLYSKVRPQAEASTGLSSFWTGRQKFFVDWIDIAFAVVLALFFVYVFVERFGQDAAIIYATIDPADRFSRAVGILAEKTVIGSYPNMYFGHITNAMFLGVTEPWFSGVYAIRAFEAKEFINVWLGGMLFYSALRQISDKPFVKILSVILGFVYTLGYPWNNELWGFGYLGVSVTLIILVQIGVRYLFNEKYKPWVGLVLISAGCFSVGISYTLFAPPVFIAAFVAIIFWKKKQLAGLVKTELIVFAIPFIMTMIFIVLMGPEASSPDLGSELVVEGAIYRNLVGDFLIWLPFALFAIVFAIAKRKPDFSWIFAIVFLIFQAYFFYRMVDGTVSSYYFYKLNFVTWFFVLFLAGQAIALLTEEKNKLNLSMIGCCLIVFLGMAVFSIRGYDHYLTERNSLMNPISATNGLFDIYTNNNAYFSDIGLNPIYYRNDFLELCSAARNERIVGARTGLENGYYQNRVETVTDHFYDSFWADALVGEHIDQKPVKGIISLPDSEARIWIVLTHSELYQQNSTIIDAYDKVFENGSGFVVLLPDMAEEK